MAPVTPSTSTSVSSASSTGASYAFTTLVTTDEYLPAALVVAHSLRLAHEAADAQDKSGLTGVTLGPWTSPKRPATKPRSEDIDLVALVTPGSLSVQSIRALLRVYDRVISVEPLGIPSILAMRQQGQLGDTASKDGDDSNAVVDLSDANLALLDRPDLGESQGAALTKLHAWRLTDYRKVVYLDADSLVLRPLSHLFHLSATFAASPDTGWPDIFNSGVMLLEPSQDTFEGLLNLAASSGTWDGADQGLINEYFGGEKGSGAEGAGGGWTRLPFTYNMTALGGYTYVPAYRRYGSGASVAHFIGGQKPWRTSRPPSRSAVARDLASGNLTSKWWDVYTTHYPLSGTSTPQEGDVEVRFTEKGVEVIERPAPKGIDIPVYQAAWAENDEAVAGGASRTLEELRATFQSSGGAGPQRSGRTGEGRYESLPLFGRLDLLPPQLQRILTAAQKAASPLDSGGSTPTASITPPTKRVQWDATVSSPPLDSTPSWRNAPDTFYTNAWDKPSSSLTPAERAEMEHRRRLFLNPNLTAEGRSFVGYIPPEAKAIHDYQHLGSERPDGGKVGKVFPWENTPAKTKVQEQQQREPLSPSVAMRYRQPTATRVFPGDSYTSSSSPDLARGPAASGRFEPPRHSPSLPSSVDHSGGGSMPVNLVDRYQNVWDQYAPSMARDSEKVAQRRIASTQGREAAAEASLRGVTQQQAAMSSAAGKRSSRGGGMAAGGRGSGATSAGLSSTESGTNTGGLAAPRSRQSTAGYTSGGHHSTATTGTTASRYYTAQSSSDNPYTDQDDDDSIADQYVLNRQPGGEGRGYAEVEGSGNWAMGAVAGSGRRRRTGAGSRAEGGAVTGAAPALGHIGGTTSGAGGEHTRRSVRRSFSPPADLAGVAPRHHHHNRHGVSEDDGDDESSDESDSAAGDASFQDAISGLPNMSDETSSSGGSLAVPSPHHNYHPQREGPGYTRKAQASGFARSHATPRSPRHSSHNVLATLSGTSPSSGGPGMTDGGSSSSPRGSIERAPVGGGEGGSPAGAAPALPALTGRARIRPEEGTRSGAW